MKIKLLHFLAATLLVCGCNGGTDPTPSPSPEPDPEPEQAFFAKGADLGWVTEMESNGCKFYNEAGQQMECTALFNSIGFNSVRHRVWVNPTDGWCGKADVLEKCKRASALGMKIMIDFHYSDWWADPGKQNVPAAWAKYDVAQMADAVAAHTQEVLQSLKSAGIDVTWVQVGNEVTNGMLWESGRVKDKTAANFIKYFNAGAAAVRKVYPDAEVILHIDNGWNISTAEWFFDLMKAGGADYDIIGFSLYPSYWDDAAKAYPDWRTKTNQFLLNISSVRSRYSKPVMLCEFGMPVKEPAKAKEALQYLMDGVQKYDWFGGIFLWEPESESSRNNYDYGAFSGGKPTEALDPFK